jgi:hypothetical protein
MNDGMYYNTHMYKKTNPQKELFGVDTQLSAGLRVRLKTSWAHLFKAEIFPILCTCEDHYALLYGRTGRPNFSVARILGLILLQEMNNLSDQEALDAFGFDIRWRYALDASEEDAYLSRRSLVEFRRRLVAKDSEMTLVRGVFERISKAAIEKLGLSTSEQRLDSTHIISNIRTRGRLDLFSNTMSLFIKTLDQDRFSLLPQPIQEWYASEPEGWFGLGQAQHKEKLDQLASYLQKLIEIFASDDEIKSSEPYQLLVRLFQEQCEVQASKSNTYDKKIVLKKKTEGETLQSAYDPDASYGHRGSGYSAHITETCNNADKPEIITDYEVHGAFRSDVGKVLDIVERLESVGLKPGILYADGGYPSVPSAFKVIEKEIDFMTPVNRSRLAEDVMGRDRFTFDANGFVIRCPEGQRPIDHRILSANNTTNRSQHAIFDGNTCRACKVLDQCPVRAPNHRDRGCGVRETVGDFRLEVTPQLRLRDQMYSRQQTTEWKERYKIRAGIEATFSELKRAHGMGRLRVRRAAKVCFAVTCKVIACNIKRWAKTHMGNPYNGLQRLLGVIFEYLSAFKVNRAKMCFVSAK